MEPELRNALANAVRIFPGTQLVEDPPERIVLCWTCKRVLPPGEVCDVPACVDVEAAHAAELEWLVMLGE